MKAQSQSMLAGVQYLRAIAAIAVVFDHAAGMASFQKYFGQDVWGKSVFTQGALGVPLFFMISGFIIPFVSLNPSSLGAKVSVSDFFLKRFFRIVPIMWLAIVSYAALRYFGRGDFELMPYLRAMLLVPYGDVDPNQIWTLRHEAIFYCLFAATYLFKSWSRPFLMVWFASPILVALLFPSIPSSTSGFADVARIVFHPCNVLFGGGFLFGLWFTRYGLTFEVRSPLTPILMVLYFVGTMVIGSMIGLDVSRLEHAMFMLFIMSPLFFWGVAFKGPINRLLFFLGDASYVIYLFHPHFISALLGLSARYFSGELLLPIVISIGLVATLLGIAIHVLVERPFLSAFGRRPAYSAA